MFFSLADRKSLLDLLQTRHTRDIARFEETSQIPMLTGEELLLVWKVDDFHDQYLPIYICTSKGKSREFIAWASTYLKQIKPFTAFIRVIDIDEFILLRNTKGIHLSVQKINTLVGLVIGETLGLQKMGMLKHLNAMAAKSTFSHAIATAVINNLPFKKNDIANKYDIARRLAGSPYSISYSNSAMGIWQNLLPIIGVDSMGNDSFNDRLFFHPINKALSNIEKGKEITKSIIADILRHPVDLDNIPSMADKIELRVENFEKVCTLISSNEHIHPQSASFVIACLANQISPGTMKHHSLLEPYSKNYPGIYAWYGVCAGLTPVSDILTYNAGLGWRISKQLLRKTNLLEYPESDIGFNEYEMLLTLDNPDTSFSTETATNLSVELVPGITTVVPWPPKTGLKITTVSQEPLEQMDLFDAKTNSVSLDNLGAKLYEAIDLFERLSGESRKSKADNKKQKPRSKKSNYGKD